MKKIAATLLALVMLLSLAACGGTTTTTDSDSGTETEQSSSSGKTLSLGTASLGGNFFTMGAAMASVIMDNAGVAVTAQAACTMWVLSTMASWTSVWPKPVQLPPA